MTKRERAQVVELLKCAADIAANGDRGSALGIAAFHLDMISVPGLRSVPGFETDPHWVRLLRGRGPVRDRDAKRKRDDWHICGPGYEFCLLEAACRVELGEWP